MDDIDEVWETARRTHGPKSYIAKMADELAHFFFRITTASSAPPSIAHWLAEARAICVDLEQLTDGAPEAVSTLNPRPPDADATKITIPRIPELWHPDANALVRKSRRLKSPRDAQEICRLAILYKPDIALRSKKMRINLEKLPAIAVRAIDRYVSTRIEEIENGDVQDSSSTKK
jgi:hypothetical protein